MSGSKDHCLDIEKLERRKIEEIEHSRKRREIVRGFERQSDTNIAEAAENLEELVRDKESFQRHFSNIKFYSITKSSEEYKNERMRRKCAAGVRVLDFGCGNGENGIYAAQCGADVTGIDISREGIENAVLNAQQAGVSGRCNFLVMDGEKMTFEDNTFDIGVEYGALHHVDLRAAMSELRRVIKPEGEMVCVEALRHNIFIHLYRRMTPHLRTGWEVDHILSVQDLDIMKSYFREVDVRFFHLAVLAAVPFRKFGMFQYLRKSLDVIDGMLLRNRFLGKYAWIMVIVLRKPIK